MKAALLWLAVSLAALSAQADEGLPAVSSLGSLLEAAWSAGEVRARIVGGPLPEMFRRFHAAKGQLVATARVMSRHREQECARYEIFFLQQGARGLRGERFDAESLRVQINYCLNGSAPSSGLDLDLLGELLGRRDE